MRPQESARVARRMAGSIDVSKEPSASSVSADLKDLIAAVDGDREAGLKLASRLPSGIPELAKVEKAFRTAGLEPPEMRWIGRGRWAGRYGGKVLVAVHASPEGRVQKMLVAGRPVRDWKEAVEASRHFLAMQDDGTPEDPEDLAAAEAEIGSDVFACVKCGGPVDLSADIDCKKCGAEYTTCPGCDQPYRMEFNEDDHCPICGYSSWSELPPDVADGWLAALMAGVKAAAETRKPQVINYDGFEANIKIVDKDGTPTIVFEGGDDLDTSVLAEWMQDPNVMLTGGLDSFLWQKNNTPVAAPKPYRGPPGG